MQFVQIMDRCTNYICFAEHLPQRRCIFHNIHVDILWKYCLYVRIHLVDFECISQQKHFSSFICKLFIEKWHSDVFIDNNNVNYQFS